MTRGSRITKREVHTADEPEIVQEHPEDAPLGWAPVQDELAANAGLSLLLVEGRQPPAIRVSNNNSICRAFQSSREYVNLCDPYCGDAHRRAMSAGSVVQYKCHAGLQCFTMPVQIGKQQNLAIIGGRAFVSGADYRSLVERFRAGELNELLVKEPFNNVIFAEQERLEKLAQKADKAARQFSVEPLQPAKDPSPAPEADQAQTSTVVATDVVKSESLPDAVDPGLALQTEVNRLRSELEYRSQ